MKPWINIWHSIYESCGKDKKIDLCPGIEIYWYKDKYYMSFYISINLILFGFTIGFQGLKKKYQTG